MYTLAVIATVAAMCIWIALPGIVAYGLCRVTDSDSAYNGAEDTAVAAIALAFVPWSLFGLWLVGAA